ncbi:hypothetical protein [Iningainema tapete]|uniref:Uncharacterized protein n=1 Tax=Iningainema tapete BLCC-T55 TaxID=2748662 RepID=A0A8J6XS86_9CYAN|nr:hypothetical protein [Iningainema tapete]MBD2775642.1 hypothetical protein [Iningainema tapete BLCC-T55]
MRQAELIQFYVSAEESFNQTTLIEAQLTKATHNTTKVQVENTNSGLLPIVLISFMIVGACIIFLGSISSNVLRDKNKVVISNHYRQVPCRKCQYFHDNHYLKCAVHPSTALTKEAVNCSDYLSNSIGLTH